MAAPDSTQPTISDWQAALDSGDERSFRELVRPHMDKLIDAARQDLDYYVAQGILQETDFSPEEVVGEGLIHAWDDRKKRPDGISIRGWLLGNSYRTLRRLVEAEQDYDDDKLVSLDERVPADSNRAVQEQFWEWYQPDAALLYEDIIPANEPIDIEAPLFTSEDTFSLDPDSRHVVMMHQEFEMPLHEVAIVMNRALKEVSELYQRARVSLSERLGYGGSERSGTTDHPAPPPGSDE